MQPCQRIKVIKQLLPTISWNNVSSKSAYLINQHCAVVSLRTGSKKLMISFKHGKYNFNFFTKVIFEEKHIKSIAMFNNSNHVQIFLWQVWVIPRH